MKQMLIALAVAAILMGCATGPSKTAVEKVSESRDHAEKPVEWVTVIEKVPYILTVTSFYGRDYLDEYRKYTYDGTRLTMVELFDNEHTLLEKTVYSGPKEEREAAVFDKEGHLQSSRVIMYDAMGNLTEKSIFDAEEVLQTISRYEYDEAGNRIKWSVFGGEEELLSFTKCILQEGKISRIDNFNPGGTLEDYFIYEYNAAGNPVKFSYFTADDTLVDFTTWEYEGNLAVLKKYHRKNGSIIRQESFEYDQEGSLIRLNYLDAAGNQREYLLNEWMYREVEKKVRK